MKLYRVVSTTCFDWIHEEPTFTTSIVVAAILAVALVLSILFPSLRLEASSSRSAKSSSIGTGTLVLPPGPKPWPLVGSVLAFGGEPLHQTLRRWSEKHGPIMTLYLGPYPMVVISNAEMAKELFCEQDQNFAHRHYMTAGKYLGFDFKSMPFATYGDRWRNLRKTYNSALLSPAKVQRSAGLRERELAHLIPQLHACFVAGSPVNISRTFRSLSTTILLAMIFGKTRFGLDKVPWLASIMKDFGALSGRLILADFFPALRGLDIQGIIGNMKSVQEQMRKCTASLFDELARKSEIAGDSTKDETDYCLADIVVKMKIKGTMDFDDLTVAVFDNIIGGTEPPAIAMDWTMAELLRHPEIMRRAQEEIDSAVGKDRLVRETDVPHLPYVQNIVKESLRLHPPAPLGICHVNKNQCKMNGYDIPARTSTLINLWATSRDPNRWPNPLEFNPDRFSEDQNSAVDALGHHYELIPFAAGRRKCPGAHLAMATMNLVVATLLHSFEWKPYGMEPGDIDVKEPLGSEFICQRQTEILCSVTPRLRDRLYQEG